MIKITLKVSRSKWDHFTSRTYKFDPTQPLIHTYFDECTKDQFMINCLILKNSELKEEIRRNNAEVMLEPSFLHELIQHNIKNSKRNRPSYSDYMKDVALYIYVLGGPKVYATLSLNLRGSLPSLATVRRKLGEQKSMNEAEFQFDNIKDQMIQKGEIMIVAVAEDDTKITPRLRYDWINDQIVGLQLPLTEHGTPTGNCFKFTTLEETKKYIENNSLATYAKLMTVRSIMPRATTYHLIIYGTLGSDRFDDVMRRWKFVKREFAQRGIVCLTYSSDGAPAFMKTMQLIADIPSSSIC